MTTEYERRRKLRLEREAAEEAQAAERATAIFGIEAPEADPLDCPECGAHVNGEWAVIDTFAASSSGPREEAAFCRQCVPLRWRLRLLDVLRREP